MIGPVTSDAITLVEAAALVEAKYGKWAELRVRRTGIDRWVASAWHWGARKALAASDLHPTPEAAVRDLLRGPESR